MKTIRQKLPQMGRIWIIDYDLTLYPYAQKEVLYSLDKNINEFIIKRLKVDLDKAAELRVRYWESHGTTLAGLQLHEQVSPDEYFDFIQNGPNIIDPKPVGGLKSFLKSLKGPKVIFTNGRSDWAHRGLKSMGLEGIFDEVYGLEHYGWIGKPEKEPYEFIESVYGIGPKLTFLDDKIDNLKSAELRGWTTIWVGPKSKNEWWPLHITELLELKELL